MQCSTAFQFNTGGQTFIIKPVSIYCVKATQNLST